MSFQVSLCYIRRSWKSSLTLGVFLFFLGFLLVISQSLAQSAANQMRAAVTQSLTGHIQILPSRSPEKDMADIFTTIWQNEHPFKPEESRTILHTVRETAAEMNIVIRPYPRIRLTAALLSDGGKTTSMIIGMENSQAPYQEVLELVEGRMAEHADEVVLPEGVAKELHVKAGDSISLLILLPGGVTADIPVKVSGIGNLRMLGLFGFSIVYGSLNWIQEGAGFDPGQVTDVVIYLDDPRRSQEFRDRLIANLGAEAFRYRITAGEGMGGFVQSIADGLGWMFYGLLLFLMIIMGALIVNLIVLLGLDRTREIGTLRALGFSRIRVCSIILGEIMTVSLGAITLGTAAGLLLLSHFATVGLAAPSATWAFAMGKKLYPVFDPVTLFISVVVAVALTAVSAFLPAWRSANVSPVDVLKE